MNKIAPYAKAITGSLVAGLASAQQALLDDGVISSAEGVGIAIATLTALALVWAVPNAAAESEGEHKADVNPDRPYAY